MKTLKAAFVLRCCSALAILILNGCAVSGSAAPTEQEKQTIPFQGPHNPSFEAGAESWLVATQDGRTAAGTPGSTVSFITATGFLPSNGIRFANMTAFNGFDQAAGSLIQDNVDFSHSTTMTFDYSIAGAIGQGGGTATLQVLFTANGTQTLWTKTVTTTTTIPIQKIGEVIALPAMPTPGRLTFKLVAVGGSTAVPGVGGSITLTNVTVGIDNIVVK